MPPSSGELWGHHLMPSKIDLDILLPTGVVVLLKCSRDQTLFQIKNQVWKEGPKYPFFHLLGDQKNYVFTSVTLDAKKEEFHDELRRLCDLHLFVPFLKLVEPNESTKQETIRNSQISIALGIPIGQIDSLEDPEVIEFRRDAVNIIKSVVCEREESTDSHVMYSFNAQEIGKSSFQYQSFRNAQLQIWLDAYKSARIEVPIEANSERVITDSLELFSRRGFINRSNPIPNYVLKICSRQEYLLNTHAIARYKYIIDTVRMGETPQLELVERNSLYSKLPKEVFHVPAYYFRRPYRVSENENPNPDVHLWRITTPFRVQVLLATFIDATDNFCVKMGIFHGEEQLCELLETSLVSTGNPRWNETLTFQISVSDLPRSARLCVSLCSLTKNKKKQEEYCMIAWGNINIFDYRGKLITGKVRCDLWPSLISSDSVSLLNPLGVTGSSLEKGRPSLELEFERYSPSSIYFPDNNQIASLARVVLENQQENESSGGSSDPVFDEKYLENLICRDPLCEVSEQDKALVWKYREYCCLEYPNSLPRLVASVKWNSRDQVVLFYQLLSEWKEIRMETALSLLDCKSADIYVREFAVKNLENLLIDSDVLDLLLQLVQSLKYEPYLKSSLSVFLLRRALSNRLIGHFLFWHLRAEISGKSWLDVRFGLILEAFCRGLSGHLKNLNRMVEALEKLTALTDTLKERRDEAPKDRLKFLSEQIRQADFVDALENLQSPVSPNVELGSLKVDSCRILDSAKRPLWLTWNNNDGGGEIESIFKNGDDLRQDMLTLQVIKLMDELWRKDGLDLKMLTYTCLATGKQAGLIQVVKKAQTVYAIQRRAGTLAAIQVNSKQLHKWLLEKNREDNKYSKAIDTFTKSCAGYCVATFILGIGDRNPDNIMVDEDGHIFHIDFGHFLGHFKKKFGINRERVPFVLTEDFLCVIAKGAECPQKSNEFKEFQQLCGKAYLIIRQHANFLISLFTLMLPTGIPELQSIQDIDYLRKTLAVDMTQEDALFYFQSRFSEAYGGGWITKLDWFFHALNGRIRDSELISK